MGILTKEAAGCVLLGVACCAGADPFLWGSLAAGSYRVGYSAHFEPDKTRRFGREKARPVLVSMWYPAASVGQPMKYERYLDIGHNFAGFLRDVVSDDLFGKKLDALSPAERAFFDALMKRESTAGYDAPPASGRFPVLLYHSGAAGSFEDNSVLCEYLASRGYVVITSAFPSGDGKHLSNNYGGPQTSWADLAFLLKWASKLPFADAANTGAFGHSMGAQYLLEWIGHPGVPLKAVVSLDTTLEYSAEDFAGHLGMRKRIAKLQPPRIPVLVAASADRSPRFETWDRYLPSRHEAAIRYFGHDDFLLHGSLARAFSGIQAQEVRWNYDRLAVTVVAFFDAFLRGNQTDWRRLVAGSDAEFRLN